MQGRKLGLASLSITLVSVTGGSCVWQFDTGPQDVTVNGIPPIVNTRNNEVPSVFAWESPSSFRLDYPTAVLEGDVLQMLNPWEGMMTAFGQVLRETTAIVPSQAVVIPDWTWALFNNGDGTFSLTANEPTTNIAVGQWGLWNQTNNAVIPPKFVLSNVAVVFDYSGTAQTGQFVTPRQNGALVMKEDGSLAIDTFIQIP